MDLDAARRASFEGWQAAAPGWERHRDSMRGVLGSLSERMVDRLAPAPGQTILELAAGPGDTGFLAAERVGPEGRLISSDFAPNMVAAARRRGEELGLTNAEFRVLDGERIDLPDGSVNGVLCRFGYMLMADPGAALAETKRVLRAGGRVVFVVWAKAEQNDWATIPRRTLIERGAMPPPEPGGPDMFALAEPARVESLLAAAGLVSLSREEVPIEWLYESTEEFWRSLLDLSSAVAAAVAPLPEEELRQIREAVDRKLERFAGPDGWRVPGLAVLVAAQA